MNIRKREEMPTRYSIMLVAFPELEATPFATWVKNASAFVLGPVFRGFENLLADLADLARYFTYRR